MRNDRGIDRKTEDAVFESYHCIKIGGIIISYLERALPANFTLTNIIYTHHLYGALIKIMLSCYNFIMNENKNEKLYENAIKNAEKVVNEKKPSDSAAGDGHVGEGQPKMKLKKDKKLIASIIVLAFGIVAAIIGVVFMILNLNTAPGLRDGEYLVDAREWVRQDEPSVIWNFTEIGRGTLTTNNHTNDYDFLWAIEGDRLMIETDWLYELENEYEYTLDMTEGRLTLSNGDAEYTFVTNQ